MTRLKHSDMPDLTYLSLGWGIQSWTLAAMVALAPIHRRDERRGVVKG